MTDIILESIRAVIAGCILFLLYISGKKQRYYNTGWKSLIIGFALLFFGMVIDVTDNFESLNKYIVIGDTKYEALIEKVVGYLFGFVFIAAGFWRWLPTIGQLIQTKDELQSSLKILEKEIFEHKETGKALRESEEKYRNILESIEEGYYEVDLTGSLIFFNDSLCRIYGYLREELIGMNNRNYMSPENAKKTYEIFNRVYNTRKSTKIFDWEFIRKDGTKADIEISVSLIRNSAGLPIGFRGIVRDVTSRRLDREEKERLEAKLQQSQKMETIGTLAGGIAHDFNNILTSIIGYSELTLAAAVKGSMLEDNIKEVITAGNRATNLVRQILAFSRQSGQEVIPIMPSLIVKEAIKLIRSATPTTIDIKQNIKSDSLVMGDQTRIHQVLMNLCTNAVHAMEETGGTLSVDLTDVQLDESFTSQYADITPGKYLKLDVSDTGTGMKPDIIESIFEPYFTTKDPGEGTGLGLSVVHGIVKGLNGETTVTSELGSGTTFTVYLPILEKSVELKSETAEIFPVGKESVLLVDDEASIVNMCRQMLTGLGYNVTTRTSSIEALELFKKRPDDFDLVLTDMTMPNMTGDRLAIELINIRPDIPVILCTGYSKKISEENAAKIGIKAFVMKPFVRSELAKTVRKVLDDQQQEQTTGRILVIDDESAIRKLFIQNLAGSGYEIIEACDGKEGLKLYHENRPDLVITDLVMPEKEGIEMITELKREFPNVKIIAISGGGKNVTEAYLHIAKNLGAERTFPKPIDWPELIKTVRELLK